MKMKGKGTNEKNVTTGMYRVESMLCMLFVPFSDSSSLHLHLLFLEKKEKVAAYRIFGHPSVGRFCSPFVGRCLYSFQ